VPLQVCVPGHPLFAGFPPSGPVLMESHYWEIKELLPMFDLLASTHWCHVQVIQHRDLPIYATQGHPEAYTAQYPDGKRLLRNFALATGIIRE
jgi:GMP synthase-like glutamine amidotransferase